jgi:hypothetical protein
LDKVPALPACHAEERLRTKGEGPAHYPSSAGGEVRLRALAFGIERMGLVSLRFPRAVAFIAVLLAIAAGIGAARLKVDDSLSELFRSETSEFKQC